MNSIYLKEVSDFISQSASEQSEFHPINRRFLEPYVDELIAMQSKDLLFYNLETKPPLYSIYFMLSLPEIWERISVDDIVDMINRFDCVLSYQSLIEFTYKYIEIDIFPLVLSSNNFKSKFQNSLIEAVKNMYLNYFKDEEDYFFFEKDLIGVPLERWAYIKQLFLLDTRIRPAVESSEYFEKSLPEIFLP
jgi:hypothetical protein